MRFISPFVLTSRMRISLRSRRPDAAAPIRTPDALEDPAWIRDVDERLRWDADDLDCLEALGVWHLARGEAAAALECFHRITRADAKYPGIWRLKALAFESIGDLPNAARCRARGSDPSS